MSPIAASPDETRDLPNGLEHLSSDSLQDQHSSTWPLASSTPSLKDPSPRKSNESQPMEANDAVGTRLSSSATDSAQSNLPVETLYQGPAPSNPDHLDQRSTKSNGDQGSESQVDHDEFETDNLQGGAFPSPGVPQLPALRFSNTDTFGRISAFVPLSSLDEDSVDETHDRRDLAAEMMNGGAMAKGTAKTHPVQDSSTRDHEPDPDQKARFFPPQNVASNDASTAQKAIGPPKLTIVTRGGDGKESFSSGSKATEISPSVRVGFAQPESAVQPTGAPEEDMKGVIDSPSPKYEGPEDGVQSPEKPPRYSFDEDSPVLSSPPVIKSPSQVRTPTGGAPAQDDGQVSPDLDPPSPMQLPSVRQAAQPRRRRSPSPEVSPERQGEESTITQDQAGDQASPALLHPGIRRQSNAKSRNSTELRPFSFLPHSPGPEEMPRQDILTRDSPRRAQPKRAPSPIEERLSTHSQDRTSTSQPPSIQEPSSPRHCSRDLSNQVSSDKTQLSPSQRSSANDRGLSPHPVSTDPYGPPSPALRSKYYTPHSPSKLEEDQYFPHPQSPDGPPIHEHPAFKQDTPHLADNPLKPNRSSQLPKTDTRPQPTEYQLPAVTPPTPEISSPKPERASGRFKGFGNVTSDPGSPQVPAQPIANRTIVEGPPPERPLAERPPAQWTALAERAAQRDTPPPTTSPAELNRKKPKRSSLFSNLTKPTSTSQEPKVSPDLRADLLQRSLQSTPQPTEPAQPKKQQALPLASLPGLKGSKADKKASKGVVQRSHTSADSDSQEGKKKRFSGFGVRHLSKLIILTLANQFLLRVSSVVRTVRLATRAMSKNPFHPQRNPEALLASPASHSLCNNNPSQIHANSFRTSRPI